jgi:hypothetical protein
MTGADLNEIIFNVVSTGTIAAVIRSSVTTGHDPRAVEGMCLNTWAAVSE